MQELGDGRLISALPLFDNGIWFLGVELGQDWGVEALQEEEDEERVCVGVHGADTGVVDIAPDMRSPVKNSFRIQKDEVGQL